MLRTRNTRYKHYITLHYLFSEQGSLPRFVWCWDVAASIAISAVWLPRMYWVFQSVTIYYWFCQLLITWAPTNLTNIQMVLLIAEYLFGKFWKFWPFVNIFNFFKYLTPLTFTFWTWILVIKVLGLSWAWSLDSGLSRNDFFVVLCDRSPFILRLRSVQTQSICLHKQGQKVL